MSWDLFSAAEAEGADPLRRRGRPDVRPRPAPAPGRLAEPPQACSVSALAALAREVLEASFPRLWVAGEISGWKRHPSGHCYFALKDAAAQVRCVMFRTDAQRLPAEPDEGMEVRALGSLTLYERRGDFQFVVRELEGQGAGGLWRLAFERLRRTLEAEGLLDPARKRPLPRHPAVVGLVTSPAGAALHDVLHVIGRRAPWTRVLLSPARVQGEGAARDIARAIRRFRPGLADVVIVGRGGGSIEDLWAFNEEAVVRAIAACPAPVISAVGHEVDVTLADLVADLRAPTPSAAAERAVPDGDAVHRGLAELEARLAAGLSRGLERRALRVDALDRALAAGIQGRLRREHDRVLRAADRLDALSPLASLRRGYAVVQDEDGRLIRGVGAVRPDRTVRVRLADGRFSARVEHVEPLDTDGGRA